MAPESFVFGTGFWGPILATAALLLIAAVGWLILLGGRRLSKVKPSPQKLETYACGEELRAGEIHADSGQFFSPIRRVFGRFYRYIRPEYVGDLNTYLFWIVVGLLLIFVSVVIVMGAS
jgi:hypothetical protein